MICPLCGSENRDGNKFCNSCGGVMEVAPAPAPAPVQVATPVAPAPAPAPVQVATPVAPAPSYCPPYVPVQPAVAVPMMVTTAKNRKRFNIFSMVATVALILSIFVLPFERAMSSSNEPTMFSELKVLYEYFGFLDGMSIVNVLLLTVIPLAAIILGIIASFTNKRALANVAGSLLIFIIVWILYNGFRFDFGYVFHMERAGFYTLFGSGVLYLIGGISGV